jgi:hypothetical protein
MKFNDRILPGLPKQLGPSITGPTVDTDFWRNKVSEAGIGPLEMGCQQQLKALRSMPPVYRVK